MSFILRAALTSAVLTLAVGLSPAHAEKRVALLIGNDAYQNVPPLRKAISDARTMAGTLKQLGFTVMVEEDLTRRRMSEALLAFDRMVEPGDTAFFFFAGHGFEIRGENVLLPTDVPEATEGQEELVRDTAFPVERIVDRLQARGARTAILVLDACRNNPFERPGKRSVRGSGGLAPMTPPEGVFVVFSAGAKQSALDRLSETDGNPNSVFTRYFAQELATPGLTLVQIAKRTQSGVKQLAATVRHEQTPAYYDQIVGDVVLNGSPGDERKISVLPQIAALPPPAAPAPQQRQPVAAEPINAPLADFMRHNGGWSVTLSFADPVTAISWRMGETGPFRETGFLDVLDPRTRKRMPNPSIQLEAETPETTLYVRTVALSGDAGGPYPIRFDPVAALERGQRKILEMTAGSWLAFGGGNGLLYYTHLMSYRCAIREVRIGLDTTLPERAVAMPPCDLKNPNAIPSNATPYLRIPPATKSVSVELTYRDGSTSEVKTFRRWRPHGDAASHLSPHAQGCPGKVFWLQMGLWRTRIDCIFRPLDPNWCSSVSICIC